MVSTVQSWNTVRIVRCTSASVSTSMLAVASSSTTTLQCRSNARAMQISWRWPWLQFSPPSATVASSLRAYCGKDTISRASANWSSL